MKLDKSSNVIKDMFNKIANHYDFLNTLISFGLHKIIKTQCIKLLNIKNDDKVLDLCCGTGDLTRIIKNYTSEVTGIDFSENMLKIAKKKDVHVNYICADITNLPFSNQSFDFVTAGFGLRNVENLEKVLTEIHRTLKSGGIFLHLDFGEKNVLSKCFDKFVLTFIGFLKPYEYLIKSKQDFYSPSELIKIFEQSGFKLLKRKDFICGAISVQILTTAL